METIVLFDPGIRSLNKGDEIIMRSAKRELEEAGILKDKFIIECATHAPVLTWYQNNRFNHRLKIYDNAKFKFICGSNLLWKNMLKPRPSLNVDMITTRPYRNSVLMGVGIGQSEDKVNSYTKLLYARILSKEYVHSTRDDATQIFLNELGYNAINTGCPTMWQFTCDFCDGIPVHKAADVVCTITDYSPDVIHDQILLNILSEEYRTVYIWLQGVFDYEYLKKLILPKNMKIVSPSIEEYEKILNLPDIDYVGTRLHAGMFAIQHKKRTIILAVDNRSIDMHSSYSLNILERTRISELPHMIENKLNNNVQIRSSNIDAWIKQFK